MLRYIGEELINQTITATPSKEIYGNRQQLTSALPVPELSNGLESSHSNLQLDATDRVLFHVSPLHNIMPDLFDVVLLSDCDVFIPERSAKMKDLAIMVAENKINLVITSLREWKSIYVALNEQQQVKQLRLVLIDDAGNLLKRSAWILRSLSAEKGDDPYESYKKARGIWK